MIVSVWISVSVVVGARPEGVGLWKTGGSEHQDDWQRALPRHCTSHQDNLFVVETISVYDGFVFRLIEIHPDYRLYTTNCIF